MSTGELAKALAAFQSEMPVIPKNQKADTGKYTYTYAGLADVCEKAMPLLAKHGLSFTCLPRRVDGGPYEIVGTLLHTSGEAVEGALPLQGGGTPQAMGSAITYARRYLLGAITGIVTDDDDDAHLAQRAATSQPRQERAPRSSGGRETGEAASQAQVGKIKGLFRTLGKGDDRDAQLAFYKWAAGVDVSSSTELTKRQASMVIEKLTERAEATEDTPPPVEPDPTMEPGWGDES